MRKGKLCGYIEATSQDISQEVKAWSQMGLPNGQQGGKEAYKAYSVTPAISGGMGQNSPNFLWEACGRLPETFENKQFKGNATKY